MSGARFDRLTKQVYILIFVLIPPLVSAQKLTGAKIQQLGQQKLPAALSEFRTFLSIPNDGNDRVQLERNLEWCRNAYRAKGFDVTTLETAGMPLLLAEKKVNNRLKTVLFYTQIDGQPATGSEWSQENPYVAVLKAPSPDGTWNSVTWDQSAFDPEWRVYARSASDSKGPAMMLMQAIDILSEQRISPEFNIKVIMDFQEEKGSPDLPEVVEKYKDRLAADFLVIMDGVRSVVNAPTLTFGARGIATVTLTLFGPKGDMHSGQFGNYVPNPVFSASRLIAKMKDEDGHVMIPGFYDGIGLSAEEKSILNLVPDEPDELGSALGIAAPEKVGATYQEALQFPTLNIRGIRAGSTGKEARTVIPAEVLIEMDIRLVPETPGQRQVDLVKQFVASQGYHFVDGAPTDAERAKYDKLAAFHYNLGSIPFRTNYDSPMSTWLMAAITRATGKVPLRMRTTGGSQPIAPFVVTLNAPAIAVRIPNPGSNIHAANENIRIGNFLEGIETCVSMLTQPIK